MRAAVIHGVEDVTVETVDDPTISTPGSAVVEVSRTSICGSDLHLYHGHFAPPGLRPGHEFVGTVVAVGNDVRRFSEGDRVLVSAVIGCGDCPPCHRGEVVRCVRQGVNVFGTNATLPGGQAEFVEVPVVDRHAHPLRGIDLEAAVMLTDVLPTGYVGARRADISPGDTVVVIGLGPVGLFAVLCAQLLGASRVLAADTVPERLAQAETLGAVPIDAGAGTPERVLALTDGLGVDAAIEAVGSDESILDAVASVRAGATVSVVGVSHRDSTPYPMRTALLRDITLRGTLASIPSTWPSLLPLVKAGRFAPLSVVTHRFGLSEVGDAYRLMDSRRDGVLKIVVDPKR